MATIAAITLAMSACSLTLEPGGTSSAPQSPASTSSSVTPDPSGATGGRAVLTHVAWNDASAEVIASGLIDRTVDDSVECEFEFSREGVTVTRSSTPEAGPSSLDCGSVYVPVDELGPGEWLVVLIHGAARSDVQKVEVP